MPKNKTAMIPAHVRHKFRFADIGLTKKGLCLWKFRVAKIIRIIWSINMAITGHVAIAAIGINLRERIAM